MIKVVTNEKCYYYQQIAYYWQQHGLAYYQTIMKFVPTLKFVRLFVCFAIFTAAVAAQDTAPVTPVTKGKTPIIIIPGLTGSNLINKRTGEEVWFKTGRSKDDDIRLPISTNLARNTDNLVSKDIIRGLKIVKFLPEIEIYERLINALETRGGYTEGKWNAPDKGGDKDTFYVFPYDWRRDNVENARLLIRQIEALKRKLGRPNLKFNVISHSMGGLISRYAAMYGNSDIPAGTPKPTWAGAKHLDKIFLLGTPNEGSISAINALLDGFSYVGGGLNLPFIQNISRFDVFTIPSMYQLLPHDGTLLVYDENLKPIPIDIYDPAVWDKYGWSIWNDKAFRKKFSVIEQRNARGFFQTALLRAKRFQAAIDANSTEKVPVSFYLMGSDCKETPNAFLLLQNQKNGRWMAQFKPDSFTRTNGEKVSAELLKPLLISMGDGVVTKRSLAAETEIGLGKTAVLPIVSEIYQCEGHSKLVTNPQIQDKLFLLLNSVTNK